VLYVSYKQAKGCQAESLLFCSFFHRTRRLHRRAKYCDQGAILRTISVFGHNVVLSGVPFGVDVSLRRMWLSRAGQRVQYETATLGEQ
ncbi:MAG: hypothetical protein JSU70_04045, partial [Phycisphaerales bacterium]